MENQVKINKYIFKGFILFILTLIACSENKPNKDIVKKDCSAIRKVSIVMFTEIDLSSYHLATSLSKNKNGTNIIKMKHYHNFTKNFDKKLGRWSFHIGDSLEIDSNYNFAFYNAKDTVKFYISDLIVGEKPIFANGENSYICTLVSYKLNGQIKKENNIYFE